MTLDYLNAIYNADCVKTLHIVVDGVDITERITAYKKSGQFMTDGVFCLGNAPSLNINLTVINTDGYITELLDKEFYIYEDISLGDWTTKLDIGYFYVYDKPEKYTEVLELTLNDSMRGLGVAYITQLQYPTTLLAQLQEMSAMSGLALAPLPSGFKTDTEINFYDSNYTIRQHLAWIAEMNGCNVIINRQKQIEFKPLSSGITKEIEMELLGDLSDENVNYVVEEVLYDNGVNRYSFKSVDEPKYTLQISEENMYILNEQIVEDIYNQINQFSLNSLSNVMVKGDPAINLGDIIALVDENGALVYKFMVLEIEETQNMSSILQIMNGKIKSAEASRTVDVVGTAQKIKRIQTIVNQNEARIDILAQEFQDVDNYIDGKLSVSAGEILAEVEAKYETIEDHEKDTEETNAKFQLYVDKEKLISYINASADVITLNSNRLEISSDNFTLSADGTLTATNGTFSGDIFGSTITFGDTATKYVSMATHTVKNEDKTETVGAKIEGNGGVYIWQHNDKIELASYYGDADILVNQVLLNAYDTTNKAPLFSVTNYDLNGTLMNSLKMSSIVADKAVKYQLYNYDALGSLANTISLNSTNSDTTKNNYLYLSNRSYAGDIANSFGLNSLATSNSAYWTNNVFGDGDKVANRIAMLHQTENEDLGYSYQTYLRLFNYDAGGTTMNSVSLNHTYSSNNIAILNRDWDGKYSNQIYLSQNETSTQSVWYNYNYLDRGKNATYLWMNSASYENAFYVRNFNEEATMQNSISMAHYTANLNNIIKLENKSNVNNDANRIEMEYLGASEATNLRLVNTSIGCGKVANRLIMGAGTNTTDMYLSNYPINDTSTTATNELRLYHSNTDNRRFSQFTNRDEAGNEINYFRLDSSPDFTSLIIANKDKTGSYIKNWINMSDSGGIEFANWYGSTSNKQGYFKIDNGGNMVLYIQNALNLSSENYNVIIKAGYGSYTPSGEGKVIITAPQGLWVNGSKIA